MGNLIFINVCEVVKESDHWWRKQREKRVPSTLKRLFLPLSCISIIFDMELIGSLI